MLRRPVVGGLGEARVCEYRVFVQRGGETHSSGTGMGRDLHASLDAGGPGEFRAPRWHVGLFSLQAPPHRPGRVPFLLRGPCHLRCPSSCPLLSSEGVTPGLRVPSYHDFLLEDVNL